MGRQEGEDAGQEERRPLRTASAEAAREGTPRLARLDAKSLACLSTGRVPARGPGTKLARFSDFRRAGVALSTNLLNSASRAGRCLPGSATLGPDCQVLRRTLAVVFLSR